TSRPGSAWRTRQPRSYAWPVPMDDFGFVEPVDSLDESIVVAVTDTTDRWFDTNLRQTLGVADADILRSAVGVMNQTTAMVAVRAAPAREHRGQSSHGRSCSRASRRCDGCRR